MPVLAHFAWRSLRARPARTALSILGIALGVAVLFAALATSAGIQAGVGQSVDATMGRAGLRVGAFEEQGLSNASIAAIRATPGVAAADPVLEQRTYLERDALATADATAGAYVAPVAVIGIDPAVEADGGLHDLGVAGGTALSAESTNDALLPADLAHELGLSVGDTLTILGMNGPVPYHLVGILSGAGPDPVAGSRSVVISLAATAALFGPRGASWVDVGLDSGHTVDGVAADLEQRLTFEPFVLTDRADLASSLEASTAGVQALTALIAAVTLFGGAFLIFNTLSMTLSERVREIGLLRAAGTTRRQVHGLVLVQALILGVAGSILGLVLGFGLSVFVVDTVGSLGSANVPIAGPDVPPLGVALAVAIGIGVSLAAALEPAIQAGRISPIEALRPAFVRHRSVVGQLRWLAATVVIVGVAGLALWPIALGPTGADGSAAGRADFFRPLVVYAVLLLVTLLTPVLLGPLGRVASLPFAVLLPAEARLSRGSLARDRKRTALTVGSLTIGLAMVVALGGLAGSVRAATDAWLTDVIPGDLVATSIRPIAASEGVASQLAAVPGVASVSPIARFAVAFRGVRVDAAAVAGSDLAADGRLTFVTGDRRAALAALDAGGATIVPQAVADEFGLNVGDTMELPVGGGMAVNERIVGIVARGLPGQSGESVLIGWSDATSRFGVLGADSFAVRFSPGAMATTEPGLAAVARGLALEPTPLAGIASAINDAFGRLFGLFDALALLAVLIGGLGIVNTLTMNVYERVREIGVLRATGMTRKQIWRMVVVEAGTMGVVGAVLGCLSGLVLAVVLGGVAGLSSSPMAVPWQTLVLSAVFGIGIAMLAAFQPARLASRLSIVRAIQFE